MRLCVTGGGTGGHLMVAETIVEAGVKEGDSLIFIGSTHGQDQKYFKENSLFDEVYFLETTGVVNQKGFKKIVALFKIFKAFLKAREILKKQKVNATEFDVVKKFDELKKISNSQNKISSYLTIQEGCDKFCHFCVVPYTRGPEYSRPFKQIIDEAKDIVQGGAKEIILFAK